MPDRIASARGAPIDHRTRLEFAAALRAEGVNAYVSLPADILRSSKAHGGARITRNGRTIVPLAQLRNGVIVHCNESGRYSVFRTDEWGFNNRPGAWRLPVEVAAIGDSYVQGACVDSTETLVANLRQEMPAILSVGLDGAGPLSMLGLVKEYLPRVKPRKVLWFYYEGNDLTDLTSELQVPQLRAYLEPGRVQGLPEYAAALDSAIVSAYPHLQSMTPAPRDNSVGFTTKLGRWARLNRLRRAVALGDVAERVDMCCDLDAFGAVLAEANRTVESWGGRLYIVYLPAPGRSLRPLAGIFTDQLRYRSRVLRLIRRMGLPVIDVYPAFQRVDDPSVLFFGTQSHYTATGYKIAADEVVRQLEQSIH